MLVGFELFLILFFLQLLILLIGIPAFLQFFLELVCAIVEYIQPGSEIDDSANFSGLGFIELSVGFIDFLPEEADHLHNQVRWKTAKFALTLIDVVSIVQTRLLLDFRPESIFDALQQGPNFGLFVVASQTAADLGGGLKCDDWGLFWNLGVSHGIFQLNFELLS